MSSKEINLEKGIIVLKRRGLISRLRQPKRQKKKKNQSQITLVWCQKLTAKCII